MSQLYPCSPELAAAHDELTRWMILARDAELERGRTALHDLAAAALAAFDAEQARRPRREGRLLTKARSAAAAYRRAAGGQH